MTKLLFLTDRFPYENSETFIENELSVLERNFDEVIIFPIGMMVGTEKVRAVGKCTLVIPPVVNIALEEVEKRGWKGKFLWSLRHLLGWFILAFLSVDMYKELFVMYRNQGVTPRRLLSLIRCEALNIRNEKWLSRRMSHYFHKEDEIFLYSYWLNASVIRIKRLFYNKGFQLKRTILRTHRHDLYIENRKEQYIPFQGKAIHIADKVVTISMDGYQYINELYPTYRDKFVNSYLGTLDHSVELYHKDSVMKIVSCSNIVPVKRVHLIIEALALIDDANIRWIHFGSGVLMDEVKTFAKEKLSKKINVEYRFKGAVANLELMNFYSQNSIDLFLNVSISEGLPVSLIEAASFGIPMIATDVGGSREILRDGQNGILLKQNAKAEDIAVAICKISALDPSEYECYRKKSREIWEDSFCAFRNYQKFIDQILYNRMEL